MIPKPLQPHSGILYYALIDLLEGKRPLGDSGICLYLSKHVADPLLRDEVYKWVIEVIILHFPERQGFHRFNGDFNSDRVELANHLLTVVEDHLHQTTNQE